MKLLALDTCLGSCSAALFDGTRVVAARRALMERGHAEAIAPMVQEVMTEAGIGPNDLTGIAVTIGPGTFTGIRIGLALAQGLSAARNLPLLPLTSMQATAAALINRGRSILVCHQAGATGLHYVQRFDASGAALSDCALMEPGDIVAASDDFVVGSSAGQLSLPGVLVPDHDLPEAQHFVAYASKLAHVPAHLIQPFYMREADAKPQKVEPVAVQRVGPTAAPLLAELHAGAFSTGWPAAEVAQMLEIPGTLALLASRGTVPLGFILLRAIAGEAELLTLAVAPNHRRKGVARLLVESGFIYLKNLRTTALHLEVSSINHAAIALYQAHGFSQSGLRRGYYSSGEDAILMRRDVP
jgi:tRNA threonylcarbamoyl adenosine modification protein YeaZ